MRWMTRKCEAGAALATSTKSGGWRVGLGSGRRKLERKCEAGAAPTTATTVGGEWGWAVELSPLSCELHAVVEEEV